MVHFIIKEQTVRTKQNLINFFAVNWRLFEMSSPLINMLPFLAEID